MSKRIHSPSKDLIFTRWKINFFYLCIFIYIFQPFHYYSVVESGNPEVPTSVLYGHFLNAHLFAKRKFGIICCTFQLYYIYNAISHFSGLIFRTQLPKASEALNFKTALISNYIGICSYILYRIVGKVVSSMLLNSFNRLITLSFRFSCVILFFMYMARYV